MPKYNSFNYQPMNKIKTVKKNKLRFELRIKDCLLCLIE